MAVRPRPPQPKASLRCWAPYGQRLLPQLGQALSGDFGRGFDATNLRHMRGFYQAFPIRDALRRELSWTHYRLLLRLELQRDRDDIDAQQDLGREENQP